jgi:hypothetical protein
VLQNKKGRTLHRKANADATGSCTQGHQPPHDRDFSLSASFRPVISLRKELTSGEPLWGIVHLGLAVIGICTFIALIAAYFQAKKVVVPGSISQRLDTASAAQPARANS